MTAIISVNSQQYKQNTTSTKTVAAWRNCIQPTFKTNIRVLSLFLIRLIHHSWYIRSEFYCQCPLNIPFQASTTTCCNISKQVQKVNTIIWPDAVNGEDNSHQKITAIKRVQVVHHQYVSHPNIPCNFQNPNPMKVPFFKVHQQVCCVPGRYDWRPLKGQDATW